MFSFFIGYFTGWSSVDGWGQSILAELAIEGLLCVALAALAGYIGGA